MGFPAGAVGQLTACSVELQGRSVSGTLTECRGLSGHPWEATSAFPPKLPVTLNHGVLTRHHRCSFSFLPVVRSSGRSERRAPLSGEPWGRRLARPALHTQWVQAVEARVGGGGFGWSSTGQALEGPCFSGPAPCLVVCVSVLASDRAGRAPDMPQTRPPPRAAPASLLESVGLL